MLKYNQLDCKPEPILIPSARGNHRTIMGVEMKVPSELLGRRLSGVPAVGGSLRFAQEVDRHRCPEKGIVFGERIGTDLFLAPRGYSGYCRLPQNPGSGRSPRPKTRTVTEKTSRPEGER